MRHGSLSWIYVFLYVAFILANTFSIVYFGLIKALQSVEDEKIAHFGKQRLLKKEKPQADLFYSSRFNFITTQEVRAGRRKSRSNYLGFQPFSHASIANREIQWLSDYNLPVKRVFPMFTPPREQHLYRVRREKGAP